MHPSLLPPNAFPLERALEAGTARLADVDAPIAPLWDPATIPLDRLPFLAWAFSVDSWNPDWAEPVKRQAVAESIALHRVKGTRASVEIVLGRLDRFAQLTEWHEAQPRQAPHTFQVVLPMVLQDGTAPGGDRATGDFAEAIIRELSRVKPLREHMTLVQSIACAGAVGIQGAARVAAFTRTDAAMTTDTSPAWALYLQTEDGEPIRGEDGAFLDTTP
jgi:phage tail P2-like protein